MKMFSGKLKSSRCEICGIERMQIDICNYGFKMDMWRHVYACQSCDIETFYYTVKINGEFNIYAIVKFDFRQNHPVPFGQSSFGKLPIMLF